MTVWKRSTPQIHLGEEIAVPLGAAISF